MWLTYVPGSQGLHRLNPVAKFAWVLAAMAWTFIVDAIWVNLAMTAGFIALAAASGVLGRLVKPWLTVVIPFGISSIVIYSLVSPMNETPLFQVESVTVWQEGFIAGATFASRVAILSSAVLVFVLSTDPRLFMNALVARGLTPGASYAVLAALDLPPELQRRTRGIFDAQQARGLDLGSGIVGRARSFVAILGPLIGGALVSTETRSLALEARGFSRRGERTFLREAPDGPIHRIVLMVGLLAIPAAIAVRVVLG